MVKNLFWIFLFAFCSAGIITILTLPVVKATGLPDNLHEKFLIKDAVSGEYRMVSLAAKPFSPDRRRQVELMSKMTKYEPVVSGIQIWFVSMLGGLTILFIAVGIGLDRHWSRLYAYRRVY